MEAGGTDYWCWRHGLWKLEAGLDSIFLPRPAGAPCCCCWEEASWSHGGTAGTAPGSKLHTLHHWLRSYSGQEAEKQNILIYIYDSVRLIRDFPSQSDILDRWDILKFIWILEAREHVEKLPGSGTLHSDKV